MVCDVALRNFQSHENTHIDFDDGFTAIVGSSNSGKSSIFRAIRLVVNNSASAASMVRSGESSLDVTLVNDFAEAVKITRGKSLSEYLVVDANKPGEDQEYKKCGVKTPEIVSQALKLSDLNFASQFDVPFMVAESPTEVAARISELTGSETLRAAVREANRLRTQITSDLKDRRLRLSDTIDTLKDQLPALKAAEQRWEAANDLVDVAGALYRRSQQIRALALGARAHQDWLKHHSVVIGDPDKATDTLNKASWCRDSSRRLRAVADDITYHAEEANKAYCAAEDLIGKQLSHEAQLNQLMEDMDICPICLRSMN